MRGIDDASITSSVLARLIADARIRHLQIHVVTDEGEVFLIGRLPNVRLRRLAEDHARSVDGVWSVVNYLKVGEPKPNAQARDGALERQMKEELQKRSFFAFARVDVHVFESELYLIGRVDTKAEYREVLGIAEQMPEVRDIHDDLKIGKLQ